MTDDPEKEKSTPMPERNKGYALLVDAYIRDLFATGVILQRLDYDVYIVNSGEDALKLIQASRPELVITELSLQQMSGLELLIHLKHTSATKEIPIIIHTAIGDKTREEHCRASGCSEFLRKPADVEVLYSAIQRATENIPREFVRLRTLLPVRVGGHTSNDSANSVEFISEISQNGFFVRTLNPRPVNSVVPVNLIIKSTPIKLKAQIVRSSYMKPGLFKDPGMGMKFAEISDTDRDLIRSFIKEQIMMDIASQE